MPGMGTIGGEAALDLNLDLAMHRFFTYPHDLRREFEAAELKSLADQGLYVDTSGRAVCNFCDWAVDASELNALKENHSKQNCSISSGESKNVPLDASVPNFKYEAHRLFSLLQKPDWQHVQPRILAKCGFYYAGAKDLVRCAFCNLEVSDWEAEDTPDGEHKRWNPGCPFFCNPLSVFNVAVGSEPTGVQHDSIAKEPTGAKPFETAHQPPARPESRGGQNVPNHPQQQHSQMQGVEEATAGEQGTTPSVS